jgi:hypothetical protein
MPNREEGLVFPNSLELQGRDRVKATIVLRVRFHDEMRLADA